MSCTSMEETQIRLTTFSYGLCFLALYYVVSVGRVYMAASIYMSEQKWMLKYD